MVKALAVALLVAGGCQCQGRGGGAAAGSGSAGSAADATAVAASLDAPPSGSGSAGSGDEPEAPPDLGKVVAGLGAIPAWQAVVDRAQLLARRGQHGVIYGTLGDALPGTPRPEDAGVAPSPYAWLVDDTEGNGALGVRAELHDFAAKLHAGDRVALGGAWKLDAARAWFWDVDALTALPAAPKSDLKEAPLAAPTHAIASGDLAPGARTISVGRDGDAVYFMLVGPIAAADGDGWLVADELGNTPFAILNLPGERASYGGLDMRAPDEKWALKRGQTYWVRIGKWHKHGADKPPTANARTAPVRVK